jgi:hypothetical protein
VWKLSGYESAYGKVSGRKISGSCTVRNYAGPVELSEMIKELNKYLFSRIGIIEKKITACSKAGMDI